MRKKVEMPKPESITALVFPVLFGTGVALLLLFLSTLLVAALIWGGILSAANPGVFLTVCAGICAFIGARAAISRKGSGKVMLIGAVMAVALCIVLILICLAVAGEVVFSAQLRAVLLIILAGGCFAGMFGSKKRKKKKR